jgi:hypothetical protein
MMCRYLCVAILVTAWLMGCGEESQVSRTDSKDAVKPKNGDNAGIKKHNGGTSNKENNNNDSDNNAITPEEQARQWEDQGLTNGGSPLAAINLSLGAAIIPVSAQTYWVATGIYEDASERDVTDLATWSTTNTSIIETIVNDPGGIKAIATGTANVTVKVGSFSTSAAMTIIP